MTTEEVNRIIAEFMGQHDGSKFDEIVTAGRFLSLDNLIPVLEKLEADFCCSRTYTKEWSFEITWINDMPCDLGKWAKSMPEAATIATAKAIQELETKR